MKLVIFAVSAFCALSTLQARAEIGPTLSPIWKHMSGGNGVDGTLLDRSSKGHASSLTPSELLGFVRAGFALQTQEFPLLLDMASFYIDGVHAKAWFLDDRTLNPDCVDPVTFDPGPDRAVWACQNDVEIRISSQRWAKLTAQAKSDLILHEVLTAVRFRDGRFATVPAAFEALVDPHLKLDEVQTTFFRLGFPTLITAAEFQIALAQMPTYLGQICQATTKNEAVRMALDDNDRLLKQPGLDRMTLLLINDAELVAAEHYYGANCSLAKPLAAGLLMEGWERRELN